MNNSPNIILITIDTVRPDFLGCYGHEPSTSPHIDKVASQSTVFDQAISNGSYTSAAFPPILSSTYSSMYGGPFSEIGKRRPLLSKLLKDAGFYTGGFTSNPLVGKDAGYDLGFDVFAEPSPKKAQNWFYLKGMQRLLKKELIQQILQRVRIDGRPPSVYVKGDKITDLAIDWISRLPNPFFLWVHYMDAHWPYHPYSMVRNPKDFARVWEDLTIMHRAYHAKYPGNLTMSRIKDLYRKAIMYMDEQIGRLIETLVLKDVYDQSLIIIASDHGEEFFEHGTWQHGISRLMYDELLHVPFIIKAPNQEKSFRVSQQVSLMDLGPTILEIVGHPPVSNMEGRSLLPYWKQGNLKAKPIVSEMVSQDWYCAAIRTEDYKYIYNDHDKDQPELFDLRNDPGEQVNLYDREHEIARRFEELLHSHLNRIQLQSRDNQRWGYGIEITERLRELGYID